MPILGHYDLMQRNERMLNFYFSGVYYYRVRPFVNAPFNWCTSYGSPMQMIVAEWDWQPFDGRPRHWRDPVNFYVERGQDVIVISQKGTLKLDDRRDALRFITTQRGVTLRRGEKETLLALRDHDFWSRFEAALTDKEFRELPPDMVEAFKDYGVFWIFAALFSDYKETSRLFEPVHQHHKQILMMLWSMMIKTQDANSRNVAPGYLWALLKNRRYIATFKRALYHYLDTPMDANALLGLLAECATRNRPSQPSYGSMHDAIVWMEEPWFLDLLTAKRNGWFTTHEELVERVGQRPRRSTTPPALESYGVVIPPWDPLTSSEEV